jgi:hypothetical protein
VFVGDGAVAGFDGCLFESNAACWAGGAVRSIHSTLTMIRCGWLDNRARVGGAVHSAHGTVIAEQCRFTGGGAAQAEFGGAMLLSGGNHLITDSSFTGFTCEGGAAVGVFAAQAMIVGCQFTHNTSTWTGGAVFASQALVRISASAFTGNAAVLVASGAGSAIEAQDDSLIIVRNAAEWDNTPPALRATSGAAIIASP